MICLKVGASHLCCDVFNTVTDILCDDPDCICFKIYIKTQVPMFYPDHIPHSCSFLKDFG